LIRSPLCADDVRETGAVIAGVAGASAIENPPQIGFVKLVVKNESAQYTK
jgi:hypothetical protein